MPCRAVGAGTGTWAMLSSIPEGACACGAEGHMASIGPLALGAKGCVERLRPTGETTQYDLCVAGAPSNHVRCASLRSGGRRLAVRIMMECHFCALPRTPFPASRDFPSRENERYGEKNRASYTSCTIPVCPPLVAGATTFPPQAGALWMLSHGAMSLPESIERFILLPEQGEVRRSRIGGGERSEPIRRMIIIPYDIESQSRNADFISIAREGNPPPSAP